MWLAGLHYPKDQSHGKPQNITRKLVAEVLNLHTNSNQKKLKILEVGVGTGENLSYLSQYPFHIYGIDNCAEMLAYAHRTVKKLQQANIQLLLGTLHELNTPLDGQENPFDGVLLFMFLSLTIDHSKFFNQLNKICHNATILVVVDFSTSQKFLANLLSHITKWINFLPNIDIEKLTHKYGWKVIHKQKVTGMVGLLTLFVLEKNAEK